MIKLKRAYDSTSPEDGHRFLVERLWPRGVKKTALHLDAWLKNVAPGTDLRQWFSHDPKKWDEFQHRYKTQLHDHPEAYAPILHAARHGVVTLIYSSHDREHNNAVALSKHLNAKLEEKGSRRKAA